MLKEVVVVNRSREMSKSMLVCALVKLMALAVSHCFNRVVRAAVAIVVV